MNIDFKVNDVVSVHRGVAGKLSKFYLPDSAPVQAKIMAIDSYEDAELVVKFFGNYYQNTTEFYHRHLSDLNAEPIKNVFFKHKCLDVLFIIHNGTYTSFTKEFNTFGDEYLLYGSGSTADLDLTELRPLYKNEQYKFKGLR